MLDTMSGNDFRLNLQEYRPTPENASEESFSKVLLDTMRWNDFRLKLEKYYLSKDCLRAVFCVLQMVGLRSQSLFRKNKLI